MQFDSGIGWHSADIESLSKGVVILTRMVLVNEDQFPSDLRQKQILIQQQWPWVCQCQPI